MRRSVRHEGLLTGLNKISQSGVITDPFALYGSEIENINIAIIGDIGKAKSSLIKTAMCVRQLALPNRQVVVIDKKRQGSKGGEYSGIADAMGAQSIRFRTGTTGMRINLLDPAIATGVERTDGVAPAGQEALVGAVIEDTMGRTLIETEKAALGLALQVVNARAAHEDREPILMELAEELLGPTEGAGATFGQLWSEESRRWVSIPVWHYANSAWATSKGSSTAQPHRRSAKHSTIRSCTSTCPRCRTRDRRCA
ncbi:hypothetical protein A3L23_05050 (plasmid) [Rhodococcoides fascians D188]|uniref:hypothetical protein n=1 Tax=Rhodococcoides fascians TaxID=1828 RepID=UPI0007AAE218|nr:hypothetical protein [Rhodococcus fascians]AMY56348.1 hypothetical protein A3L23_05050 [Rhodococcus fascians D188]